MSARILIVDDDPAVRDSIQEFLTILNYRVDAAASAEEAMEVIRNKHADVIITDIMMEGMDGLELTQFIKAHYDSDVIVMTGYTGDYTYEEAINKGADDFVFKPIKFEELKLRLKRVLRERRLAKERMLMLDQLQELAITDDLTKLFNSRHFYNQLENEVNRYQRYKRPFSILMIDLDHFKRFNDTYGHLEGDRILRQVGRKITSCMRTMDTAYRYGGEEFTVLLPETDCEAAVTVAERIKDAVNRETTGLIDESSVTVSIGVTEYSDADSISALIKRADKAMYVAKQRGRNCIAYWQPDQETATYHVYQG
ncbi:MAG TPA: diguanylate cyclase [Desulfosalsimonadaceae bacterium]|nr:diguanylate cyclase [Desulfosalsimonadaceae bacterium]